MRRQTLFLFFVSLTLTVAFSVVWSAAGDEQEGDTATNIVAASGAEAGTSNAPKKKGNRFARFFKAPFKAVGKIFTGGDDGDDKKLARMTEKDAARFESAAVMRVEDRTTERPVITGGEGTARDLLERGRTLLERGALNEAIAELSRAASLDPRLAEAHKLLALAYERKGLPERARDSFERALDLDEHDAQTLNNLGYSLYLNGRYRAAVDRLKRAARLAPADARILNNLALAQVRLGKYDDAYKNFARAGGEYNGHMNIAAMLERVGRDSEAVRHYEEARRLQPSSTVALVRLVELYERTGDPDKAAQARHTLDALEHSGSPAAGGE